MTWYNVYNDIFVHLCVPCCYKLQKILYHNPLHAQIVEMQCTTRWARLLIAPEMDLLMILDAKWVCGVIHMLLDIHFGVDYCNWKKLITCIVAATMALKPKWGY